MSTKKTILLTGGCGFIGHHFAEYIHKNTDWNIVIIDKLTYASMGLNRIRNNELLYSKRVKVFTVDLCNELSEDKFIDKYELTLAERDTSGAHKSEKDFIVKNLAKNIIRISEMEQNEYEIMLNECAIAAETNRQKCLDYIEENSILDNIINDYKINFK